MLPRQVEKMAVLIEVAYNLPVVYQVVVGCQARSTFHTPYH